MNYLMIQKFSSPSSNWCKAKKVGLAKKMSVIILLVVPIIIALLAWVALSANEGQSAQALESAINENQTES